METDRDGKDPSSEVHPHLTPTVTSRGFCHLPPIASTYSGNVRVYESSAALAPHIWLRVVNNQRFDPEEPEVEAVAHLTVHDAWRLAEQLITLVLDHYQGLTLPEDRCYEVTERVGQ